MGVLAGIMNLKTCNFSSREGFADDANLTPELLKCEYLSNPLGIDVGRPRLSWVLESQKRNEIQTAWQVQIAKSVESLSSGEAGFWDSGKIISSDSAQIEYSGKPLAMGDCCYWRVRIWDREDRPSSWSQPAFWTMGPMKPEDWRGEWIGAPIAGWMPWLRKKFSLEQLPARAFVHVAALGYFELYLNGHRISEDVLAPAVSDHSARALCITYDVTEHLSPGENCIALWMGDKGWYAKGRFQEIHDRPLVRAMLVAGGLNIQPVVETDNSWKISPSHIDAINSGRRYDSRRFIAAWNRAELDDRGWESAEIFHPSTRLIKSQMVEPDRLISEIAAKSVETLETDEYLIDMGRNFTGWIEARLHADEGNTVLLDYAEQRGSTGELVTYSQHDEYIVGTGENCFMNRFEYRAFRWLKIKGVSARPGLEDIKGYLIHTAFEDAGDFACSNELLNRIYQTVVWTYRCVNLGGYSVDCPHRERLGYGGDGQVTMETGLWNFQTGGLYTKWLQDWQDAQNLETGELPNVAPSASAGGGPTWGAICVLLPWSMYLHYGDRRVLEENYPMMSRYLGYLSSLLQSNLIQPVGQNIYEFLGDWVAPDRDQDIGPWSSEECRIFFVNLYHLYLCQTMHKISALLDYVEEASKYAGKAESIKESMNREFFDSKKITYVNGEQPYLAFALLTDLVPESHLAAIQAKLEREIVIVRKGHIHAGMHGTWLLLKYMNMIGRDDLIFLMVNQESYPGWGYMLSQGATTIWERWDGHYSQIHSTLLSVGSWFHEGIAGIGPDESNPGFKHFWIKPAVVGDLRWARASYNSILGRVFVEWRRDGMAFEIDVIVPPNSSATLHIPCDPNAELQEGGSAAKDAFGVRSVESMDAKFVVKVGSGSYSFKTQLTCSISP